MLAEQLGIRIERSSPGQRFQRQDLTKIQAWAAGWFRNNLLGPQGQATREYIEKRGIDAQTCETFLVGLAPEGWDGLLVAARRNGISDEQLFEAGLIKPREKGTGYYDAFRNRLMFPIRDISGHVIGFGGRALDDSPAKYINSPETALFNKSKTLYGLDVARNFAQPAKRVLVVEGYVDCVMCHQYGYGETVAVLGTALTDLHVQVLRRQVDSVILVFDGDEAGYRAADRALEIVLNGQLDVRLAILPEGCDPADLLVAGRKAEFEAALASATDALEFRWQRFMQSFSGTDGTGPAGRRATEAFLQFLAQMPTLSTADALQRGIWSVRVAKLLGLEVQEVTQTLRRMQRRRAPTARQDSTGAGTAPGIQSASGAGDDTYNSSSGDESSGPEGSTGAGGDNGTRRSRPEQVALRQIVEVLLNEPGYYDMIREVLEIEAIGDADLRQVAMVLRDLCESGLPWELTDLLARLPEARFGQLVTDMQMADQRRGQPDRTLDGAIHCLHDAAILRERARTVEQAEIRAA